MHLDIIAELWENLRHHINPLDRSEAAETLVSTLLDNDFDIDSIRAALPWRGDQDLKAALAGYEDEDAATDYDSDEEADEEEDW